LVIYFIAAFCIAALVLHLFCYLMNDEKMLNPAKIMLWCYFFAIIIIVIVVNVVNV